MSRIVYSFEFPQGWTVFSYMQAFVNMKFSYLYIFFCGGKHVYRLRVL